MTKPWLVAANEEHCAELIQTLERNICDRKNETTRQVPQAKIVRIPKAYHIIYRSNEADIVREIRSFADVLPQ